METRHPTIAVKCRGSRPCSKRSGVAGGAGDPLVSISVRYPLANAIGDPAGMYAIMYCKALHAYAMNAQVPM